jgi:predicted DNA-binding transcriptional regulator AlpA
MPTYDLKKLQSSKESSHTKLQQQQRNTFCQLPNQGPVTCGHLAAWLSVSTRQIYRMVEHGFLPAPKAISPTLRRFDAAEVWTFYNRKLSQDENGDNLQVKC